MLSIYKWPQNSQTYFLKQFTLLMGASKSWQNGLRTNFSRALLKKIRVLLFIESVLRTEKHSHEFCDFSLILQENTFPELERMTMREPVKNYHNNSSHIITSSSVPGTVFWLCVYHRRYSLLLGLMKTLGGLKVPQFLKSLFKNKNRKWCTVANI